MDFPPLNLDPKASLDYFWSEETPYKREHLMKRLREVCQNVSREEIVLMRQALMDGKFDGRTYLDKETKCGCFYGTLALIRGLDEEAQNTIQEALNNQDGDIPRAILSDFLNMPVVGCNRDILEDFVWDIRGEYPSDVKAAFLDMLDEYLAESE